MKFLLSIALAVMTLLSVQAPAVAFDATVSPLCRGEAAKDHVNYCAELAQGSLLTPHRFDDNACEEAKNED